LVQFGFERGGHLAIEIMKWGNAHTALGERAEMRSALERSIGHSLRGVLHGNLKVLHGTCQSNALVLRRADHLVRIYANHDDIAALQHRARGGVSLRAAL